MFKIVPIQNNHENQCKIYFHVLCLNCSTNQKHGDLPEGFGAVRATRKKAMRDLITFENAYNKRQATQRLQAEPRVPHPDILRQNPVQELEEVMDTLMESTKLLVA